MGLERARVEGERPVRRLLQSWTGDDEDQGFPDSSVGKESAFSAGDPGSIPGLGLLNVPCNLIPSAVLIVSL